MASSAFSRRLVMRGVFTVLILGLVVLQLMPLETHPRGWAPPDLILGITFAWVLRRPDDVPAVLIGPLMLMVDLLLQRPPGLMAALVVLATEYLRSRATTRRDLSFAAEWIMVIMTVLAIAVANRVILSVVGVAQAQLSLSLVQVGLTAVAYPLIVLFCQSVLGVRRSASGDAATLGGGG